MLAGVLQHELTCHQGKQKIQAVVGAGKEVKLGEDGGQIRVASREG